MALFTTNGINKEIANILVGMTFISVILSNFVQGMTLKHLIAAYYPTEQEKVIDLNNMKIHYQFFHKLDVSLQNMFNLLNKDIREEKKNQKNKLKNATGLSSALIVTEDVFDKESSESLKSNDLSFELSDNSFDLPDNNQDAM